MKKLFTSIIVLLLVAVIIITIGIGSSWFTNGDIKTWFKKDEQTEELPEESGGAVITESNGYGVSLFIEIIAPEDYEANGISPQAENAYTLTATVTPDFAIDKTVDWSIRFTDPSSAWATGKTVTDYVTVTPTSDGALTATVTCLKAFGEQIGIWVTSRQNPSAKAECTVDYVKRLVDVSAQIITLMQGQFSGPMGTTYGEVYKQSFYINKDSTAMQTLAFNTYSEIGSRGYYSTEINITPVWGDGTVENAVKDSSTLLRWSDYVKNATRGFPSATGDKTVKAGSNNYTFNKPCFISLFSSPDAAWSPMATFLNGIPAETETIRFVVTVTPETGEEITVYLPLHIDVSAAMNVSSVSIDNSDITF